MTVAPRLFVGLGEPPDWRDTRLVLPGAVGAMPSLGRPWTAERSVAVLVRDFPVALLLPTTPETTAIDQRLGPKSSDSQESSGVCGVGAGASRTDAEPGASEGSGGAFAERVNRFSSAVPRP